MLRQNKFRNFKHCKAKLAKAEAINWIFTQCKFSNLMCCEAKFARIEASDWNSHAEQVQQLNAFGGKSGKNLRPLIEMLTQIRFSNLMRCEAKLAKVGAIDWNIYAEKVQQLDGTWGKIDRSRSYWLKCLRRKRSATWCVVRQNWEN